MISKRELCEHISQLALKSILFEVSASPKPGLVDRYNSGAHNDMDFYSFMSSSAALAHTLYKCAVVGANYKKEDTKDILKLLRPIGVLGEEKMFKATSGVNTHKGLLFSLGLICAATSKYFRDNKNIPIGAEEICFKVAEITKGITKQELTQISISKDLSYGEELYIKHGVKGIRGEVESGFATVRNKGLPIMRELMAKKNHPINDILVQVLLHLMTITEDSNIIARGDMSTLDRVKSMAKEVLFWGGIFTTNGKQAIAKMEDLFIKERISPGGSADLLAVTLMLYFVETSDILG